MLLLNRRKIVEGLLNFTAESFLVPARSCPRNVKHSSVVLMMYQK